MLLTPEQLQEIRRIIQDYHSAFVVNVVGPTAVAPEILARLKAKGLVDIRIQSIQDAYIYGQLLAHLDNPAIARMTYTQFRDFIKRNPIPMTLVEKQAVKMAEASAGQYCAGLGNRVDMATGATLIEADAALRNQLKDVIRTETAEAISRRESVQKLASNLGHATGDWSRDWRRIANTEVQQAMQTGLADRYREDYGTSVRVAKVPMPDACFRAGTPILTQRGKVSIEQLRVGDLVLTHKMRWRPVTHLFQRLFSGNLYGVNGRRPQATGNHPYLADLDWRRVDSLKGGEYVVETIVSGEAQDDPALGLEQSVLDHVSAVGSSSGVPVTAVQLYRYLQMRDSNIDVEWANGHFWNGRELLEGIDQGQTFGGRGTTGVLSGLGFTGLCLWGNRQLAGLASRVRELLAFLLGHALQSRPLAFGLGGVGEPIFLEPFGDSSPRDLESLRQRFQGMFARVPGQEQFGLGNGFSMVHGRTITPHVGIVKSIDTESFKGLVYNLEVKEDQSYVADGLVVHNCEHCKRLFLGPDGKPYIWRLADLQAFGTNVGRKTRDWQPTVGTVHPNCQCQMIRIPVNFGFDALGRMVPGGKLGVEADADDFMRSLQLEDEFHKSVSSNDLVNFQGITVHVENRAGELRHWESATGERGITHMLCAYGEVVGTNGADGDGLDVYLGPDPKANTVFVVHQQNPETGVYDEEKAMLGFPSEEFALQVYRAHFNKPGFDVAVSPMGVEQFKVWADATIAAKGEGKSETIRLVIPLEKAQAGPFIGPRGGKWADPEMTIHWEDRPEKPEAQAQEEPSAAPSAKQQIPEHLAKRLARRQPGHGEKIALNKEELGLVLATGKYALVSAGKNPNSPEDAKLTPADFAKRTEQLRQQLVTDGFAYSDVVGHYGEMENSFLVMIHDADREHVRKLGELFNQDTILYSAGGKHEYHFTTGQKKGQYVKSEGHQTFEVAPSDYYTEFTHPDGSITKFLLNLDFDHVFQSEVAKEIAPEVPVQPVPPKSVGRESRDRPAPEWGPGRGVWHAERYSFGESPDAKPLDTISVADLPKDWLDQNAYDMRDAVQAKFGKLEAPPGYQIIYRTGSGPKGLANRNAGNLEAVVDFVRHYEDRGIEYGNKITAYAVRMPEEFADYEKRKGAYLKEGMNKAMPQAGPYIGPRGGKWANPELTISWKEHKARQHATAALAGGSFNQGHWQPRPASEWEDEEAKLRAKLTEARTSGLPRWMELSTPYYRPDRPLSGPVQPEMDLKVAEVAIGAETLEYAVAFDGQGRQLFRASSDQRGYVRFNEKQIAAFRADGNAILSHNHPTSMSFSAEDIHLMVASNLKEIRAVGKNGTVYSATRPKGGWKQVHVDEMAVIAKTVLETATDLATREMDAIIYAAGGIPGTENAKGYTYEVWHGIILGSQEKALKVLFDSYGVGFRKDKIVPGAAKDRGRGDRPGSGEPRAEVRQEFQKPEQLQLLDAAERVYRQFKQKQRGGQVEKSDDPGIAAIVAAGNSMAGARNPGRGTAPNFLFNAPIRGPARTDPRVFKEMVEDEKREEDMENARRRRRRDRRIYNVTKPIPDHVFVLQAPLEWRSYEKIRDGKHLERQAKIKKFERDNTGLLNEDHVFIRKSENDPEDR